MTSFIFILIFVGIIIGFIGGYAGIGGAPFMIALLVLIFNIPQIEAQGIVLTMMLGPMSLLGLLGLKKEVLEQKWSIVIGVLSYALFSYIGAVLAFKLKSPDLKLFFALFLFLVALIQFLPKKIHKKTIKKMPYFWVLFVGIITGIIGGLFGIGAGVLMVPIFIIFFHMEKNYARALSLAILLPPVSIGAFLKYQGEGVINIKYSLILFFAYFFANYFGAKLGSKSKDSTFNISYAILLASIAFLYLL